MPENGLTGETGRPSPRSNEILFARPLFEDAMKSRLGKSHAHARARARARACINNLKGRTPKAVSARNRIFLIIGPLCRR